MAYEDKDPRTVEALDKIKAILVEYDLFAVFTVISSERTHWLYHVDPSWSCLSINPATGEARIRAKVADFVTPEQQQRVLNLTGGALRSCVDLGLNQAATFKPLYDILNKARPMIHSVGDLELKT